MPQLDAYGEWLKIAQDRRGSDGLPLTHYDLLGLKPEDASPDRVMKGAVERTVVVRAYDNSPQEEARQWVDRLRGEIAEAMRCLSDPVKRREYDRKHLGLGEAAPKEDGEPAASRARVAGDPGPALADLSEADQLVLQWLMHAGKRGTQQGGAEAPQPGGRDIEAAKELWATRAVHRAQWLEEVSKRRETSRVRRRVAVVLAAAACASTGIVAIVFVLSAGVRKPAGHLLPEDRTTRTAQRDSEPAHDPPGPKEPPSLNASPGSLPKSSPEPGIAVPGAAPGTGTGTQPRPRSVVLTISETANEGDTVALKAEIGTGVMPVPEPVTIDWGDGTTPDETRPAPSPATPSAYALEGRHVYADNGEFEVLVTTRPDYGARRIATQRVKVKNVAPKITRVKCEVQPDRTVRAHVVFTEPGSKDEPLVEVRWGDGAEEFLNPAPPLTQGEQEVTGHHTYAEGGTYTVEVAVTDKDEGLGEARHAVSVSRGPDSSNRPRQASSARSSPAGDDRWVAIILYETVKMRLSDFELMGETSERVVNTAAVYGKARAHAKATELRRKYGGSVRMIETSSREEAQRVIEQFRKRSQSGSVFKER